MFYPWFVSLKIQEEERDTLNNVLWVPIIEPNGERKKKKKRKRKRKRKRQAIYKHFPPCPCTLPNIALVKWWG